MRCVVEHFERCAAAHVTVPRSDGRGDVEIADFLAAIGPVRTRCCTHSRVCVSTTTPHRPAHMRVVVPLLRQAGADVHMYERAAGVTGVMEAAAGRSDGSSAKSGGEGDADVVGGVGVANGASHAPPHCFCMRLSVCARVTAALPTNQLRVMWDTRKPPGACVLEAADDGAEVLLPPPPTDIIPLSRLSDDHLDLLALMFTTVKLLFINGALPVLPACVRIVGAYPQHSRRCKPTPSQLLRRLCLPAGSLNT